MGAGGGLGFEVRVRRMEKAVFLVRCVLCSASRVFGRYSHLGCWLAVEMVYRWSSAARQGVVEVGSANLDGQRGSFCQEKRKGAGFPTPSSAVLCEELHFERDFILTI